MALLLDTSVAIPLRDGDPAVVARAATLSVAPYLSILTVVELEGGVTAKPDLATARRAMLDALLTRIDILPFDQPEHRSYRHLLAATGYDRRKVIDRMIAAKALAHGLAVATRNIRDFQDVPGLATEIW